MRIVVSLIILVVLLGLIISFIVYGLKGKASGLKIMLLGLNVTLFGGIIAVDPNSNLGGIEYLIVFLGLVLSFIGFARND